MFRNSIVTKTVNSKHLYLRTLHELLHLKKKI